MNISLEKKVDSLVSGAKKIGSGMRSVVFEKETNKGKVIIALEFGNRAHAQSKVILQQFYADYGLTTVPAEMEAVNYHKSSEISIELLNLVPAATNPSNTEVLLVTKYEYPHPVSSLNNLLWSDKVSKEKKKQYLIAVAQLLAKYYELRSTFELEFPHKDIKTENIVIVMTPNGPVAELIDFEFEYIDQDPDELIGTLAYMHLDRLDDPTKRGDATDLKHLFAILLIEAINSQSISELIGFNVKERQIYYQISFDSINPTANEIGLPYSALSRIITDGYWNENLTIETYAMSLLSLIK